MEEAQAEVDAATAELRDINARIAEVNQRKTRLVSNLNAWLAALPPRVMLEPYTAPPSKSKAVGGVEGVEALRAQILKKRADMSRIAAAPVTYDMSVAAMRAQITRLAEAGKPNILGCAEDARPVQFVTQQISGDVLLAQGAGITTFVQPNLLALFCYLHGDALMAKLEDELADLADPAGLSDEAKASQIAALEAEVLELERQEEAAIMLSEATGAPIARRADANPLAVLELVAA
jgi:hypothetical protein